MILSIVSQNRLWKPFWIITGSLILCYGGSLTAVSAFAGDYVSAYIGFLLFALGYRLSQFGIHELHEAREIGFDIDYQKAVKRYGILALGVGIATIGGVIGAQSVESLEFTKMVIAGVFMAGGYIVGHIGVNNAYV